MSVCWHDLFFSKRESIGRSKIFSASASLSTSISSFFSSSKLPFFCLFLTVLLSSEPTVNILDSSDQAVRIGEMVVCRAMVDSAEEVRVRGGVGEDDLLEEVDWLCVEEEYGEKAGEKAVEEDCRRWGGVLGALTAMEQGEDEVVFEKEDASLLRRTGEGEMRP
jgi:hypothetical protein